MNQSSPETARQVFAYQLARRGYDPKLGMTKDALDAFDVAIGLAQTPKVSPCVLCGEPGHTTLVCPTGTVPISSTVDHAQNPEDWLAQAIERFGPMPDGNTEASRLIAAIHYAFVEGAMAATAALSDTSTVRCAKCGIAFKPDDDVFATHLRTVHMKCPDISTDRHDPTAQARATGTFWVEGETDSSPDREDK